MSPQKRQIEKRIENNQQRISKIEWFMMGVIITICLVFIILNMRIDRINSELQNVPHKVCRNETTLDIKEFPKNSSLGCLGYWTRDSERIYQRSFNNEYCYWEEVKEVCEIK